MRLIDADELKKRLHEYCIDNDTDCQKDYDFLGIDECIDNAPTVESKTTADCIIAYGDGYETARRLSERPQGEWIITSKDTEGIHKIECPFCKYEKGSDFEPYIKVTFDKLPPFCEKCGADMRGGKEC